MKFNRNTWVLTIAAGLAIVLLYAISFGNRINPNTTPQGTPQGSTQKGKVIPFGNNQPKIIPENNLSKKPEANNQEMKMPQQIGNMQSKSESIQKQVKQMDGVDDARAMVVGNTCLIGIKASKSVKDIDTIKKTIAQKVKSMDKSITDVAVSDSSDIISKINHAWKSVENNQNVDMNKMKNDMNEIMRSVTPVVK